MKRVSVNSSHIASVGHDNVSHTLEVEFVNGRVYQYHQVPRAYFDRMLEHDSPGTYFSDNIKSNYGHREVKDDKAP